MSANALTISLLKKYDVPTPRYTSYPTVPCWDTDSFSKDNWVTSVKKIFDETNMEKGISLYIHLPFCESLCTYCACTTRITKNHQVETSLYSGNTQGMGDVQKDFGKTPIRARIAFGRRNSHFFQCPESPMAD